MAPASSDTLLKIDSVFFTIRIFPLFAGKIRFNDLKISNTSIHFIRKKERNNFSYLLIKKGKIKLDSVAAKTDYGLLTEQLITTIFDAVPASVNFKNCSIKIETDNTIRSFLSC